MTCRDLEGLIALRIEGDLAEKEQQQLDVHLRSCLVCRRLFEELSDSQAAFKSLRPDVADDVSLASVRMRVMSGIDLEGGGFFERLLFGGLRQKATLAGIALLLVGAGLVWVIRAKAPQADPQSTAEWPAVVRMPETSAIAAPVTVQPASRRVRPIRATRPSEPVPEPMPEQVHAPISEPMPEQQPIKQAEPQVTIRWVTDDPNVIIYWLGDEKGE